MGNCTSTHAVEHTPRGASEHHSKKYNVLDASAGSGHLTGDPAAFRSLMREGQHRSKTNAMSATSVRSGSFTSVSGLHTSSDTSSPTPYDDVSPSATNDNRLDGNLMCAPSAPSDGDSQDVMEDVPLFPADELDALTDGFAFANTMADVDGNVNTNTNTNTNTIPQEGWQAQDWKEPEPEQQPESGLDSDLKQEPQQQQDQDDAQGPEEGQEEAEEEKVTAQKTALTSLAKMPSTMTTTTAPRNDDATQDKSTSTEDQSSLPLLFALMTRGNAIVRGAMDDISTIIDQGDMDAAAQAFIDFDRWNRLYALMEDGNGFIHSNTNTIATTPKGMMLIINDEPNATSAPAGPKLSHHTEEYQSLEKAMREECSSSDRQLERMREAWTKLRKEGVSEALHQDTTEVKLPEINVSNQIISEELSNMMKAGATTDIGEDDEDSDFKFFIEYANDVLRRHIQPQIQPQEQTTTQTQPQSELQSVPQAELCLEQRPASPTGPFIQARTLITSSDLGYESEGEDDTLDSMTGEDTSGQGSEWDDDIISTSELEAPDEDEEPNTEDEIEEDISEKGLDGASMVALPDVHEKAASLARQIPSGGKAANIATRAALAPEEARQEEEDVNGRDTPPPMSPFPTAPTSLLGKASSHDKSLASETDSVQVFDSTDWICLDSSNWKIVQGNVEESIPKDHYEAVQRALYPYN